MTATQHGVRVQRHPMRGGFYGLLLGLSVAIYLVLFAVTPFRISTLVIIVVIGVVVGGLWGAFAPAKKGDGPNPDEHAFGSVFTSAADEGPGPSYEEKFGSTVQAAADDGAFGAAASDSGGDSGGGDGGGDGGD